MTVMQRLRQLYTQRDLDYYHRLDMYEPREDMLELDFCIQQVTNEPVTQPKEDLTCPLSQQLAFSF